jgi:site-specific DNA-methyltransferase (adenine-specific)
MEPLEREFGKFDLDPCAMPQTAKAPSFYTKEQDGLKQAWKGKVFLNPPYSNPGPWLRKALEETSCGNASLVVALIPGCTDTRWFHSYVNGKAEIRFLKGRVRFLGWMGTPIPSPRRPSLLAIYRPPTISTT